MRELREIAGAVGLTAIHELAPISRRAPRGGAARDFEEHSYRLACDGGEGAMGHPRVWLQIPKDVGYVICPYCDCKYIHESFAEQLT